MKHPQIMLARFFVYRLLGADYDGSPYTQSGERVAGLAVSGIRLVIDEFRADVTKRRKTAAAGGCGSTTAAARNPRSLSSGCGSSLTAPRPPASCTAARWS
jgi:hypothetical protein